jgi:hypothetical protein
MVDIVEPHVSIIKNQSNDLAFFKFRFFKKIMKFMQRVIITLAHGLTFNKQFKKQNT